MILTVTLNAAIDRTVAVPNFRLGHRHRAVESRTVAGGKGINVARALGLLGRPVIATGFAGGPTGTRVLEQLREEAVLTDFTRIAGETRINLAVIDPTSGEQTEINERGPAVSPEEVERFVERLGYLAGGAQICVLAGSLPPGAGDDLYARLVKDLRERGVAVDPRRRGRGDAGRPARRRLDRHPERARGRGAGRAGVRRPRRPRPRPRRAGPARRRRGGDHPARRLRGRGRRGRRARASSRSRTEPLDPVSTVGSGDAFLAGYVAARYDGPRARASASPTAVACGAESTQHFGAGAVDRNQVERLLGEVEVHDLEVPAEV